MLSILLRKGRVNRMSFNYFLQLMPRVGMSHCRCFGPGPQRVVVLPQAVGLLVARHRYEPGGGIVTAFHYSAGVAAVAGGGPLPLASCMM